MEQDVKTDGAPNAGASKAKAEKIKNGGDARAPSSPGAELAPQKGPASPLLPLAEGVWHAHSTIRMPGGSRLPIRATVLRLDDGGLLVHSPVKLARDLAEAVEAKGKVRVLFAPNAFHHRYLSEWQERFPSAVTYGPDRLEARRPKLRLDYVIEGVEREPFGPSIQVEPIRGVPRLDEIALYHKPTRTLVLADLLFNMGEVSGLLKWVMRAMGTHKRTGQSRLMRLLIRDRRAYRRSIERLVDLPVDRIVVSHGEILEGAPAITALDSLRPKK